MRNLDAYDLFCILTLQEHSHKDAHEEAKTQDEAAEYDVECACRAYLKEEGIGETKQPKTKRS
ncbi:hypothetical protein GC177_03050 [bacterium]|nr:hypothetical protein [bacterium]